MDIHLYNSFINIFIEFNYYYLVHRYGLFCEGQLAFVSAF